MNNWKYNDVVCYILYQQFFTEPNYIRDRRSRTKIKVEGSGEIMEALKTLIRERSKLWEEGKQDKFIIQLSQDFQIEAKKVREKFQYRCEILPPEQKKDDIFTLMLVLSDVISFVQEGVHQEVIQLLRKKVGNSVNNKAFQKTLDQIAQTGNIDFSLLLNLGILLKYSKLVEIPVSKELFEKYLKKVSELIKKESH
ncbi:MAG: hypothetical protein GF308_18960 [Candidatus Heimdallarchaeota archaeon]|nr:hypothetical protein [Candidatus Heimdallarchaeota archaeon]